MPEKYAKKEVTLMDNKAKNTATAKQKMENMKYEIANQIGVNLKKGYNGDLTSKDAGYVGGYMVKKMIEDTENSRSK